jgi:hypothetical protein
MTSETYMSTLTRTITLFLTLVLSSLYAQGTDYAKAIAYGQSFKSRLQYLDKGLKDQKVQLASAWAKDGMSKYVTFFTDYEAVAAAAAQAKQEMREFTTEDAKKLPLSGLVFAHVEVHARGMIPVGKLSKRYVQNAAHLVLEVDGKVIQPLSKELKKVSDASVIIPVGFYTYWQANDNISILTGGPLGVEGAKAEMEFVFAMDPSIKTKKGKVILIDADGNKHQEDVDFGKILQ